MPKEEKLLAAFGKNVAKARKVRGITQSQLAELINMSVVTVAYIETGKRWASILTIYKIASALKIKIPELLNGLENDIAGT